MTPWYERLALDVLVRSTALYLRCRGSREAIARHLSMDDLPSREDNLLADVDLAGMRKVVMTARDAELLGYIRAFEAIHRRDPMTVAIVYGAGHMRAVTSLLISELRYRVVEAEWVTVFTF